MSDKAPSSENSSAAAISAVHVLDMISGVPFDETYTALYSGMSQLDVASRWKDRCNPSRLHVCDLILSLKDLECPHGAFFRYRSIETDLLSCVLQRAATAALGKLASRELWPMGAEEDAYFTVDAAAMPLCLGRRRIATLRDYARFALLHLRGKEIDGRRIVPADWIAGTRFGADPALFGGIFQKILPAVAYHNQFWIEDTTRGVYMARGVFGQLIYIGPVADLAAVVLSSWPEFVSRVRMRTALAVIGAIRGALSS
ncbi:serine hydrolase [Sinorhizobium meliloti]|uniref:serine hydrolase n=1 Tax=Rhizobium meliloti TaxID=382 RepID=UPI00398D45E4